MIIEKFRIGARGKETIYVISNSISDTRKDHPDEIARFDDLETAVLVLKFMRGDSLTKEEQELAKEALRQV